MENKKNNLFSEAMHGNLDHLRALIAAGADIEAQDEFGDTALTLSVEKGHLACVQYLVEQGANIQPESEYVIITPLQASAAHGHLDCLKYLVEKGADIHAKDEDGKTALMFSEEENHKEVADYLRKQGAK